MFIADFSAVMRSSYYWGFGWVVFVVIGRNCLLVDAMAKRIDKILEKNYSLSILFLVVSEGLLS